MESVEPASTDDAGENSTEEPRPTEILEPPTDEQKEAADKKLRELMLAKQRGLTTVVDQLLSELQAEVPTYAPVWEAVGDDLVERKQKRKAKEMYKKALDLDPENSRIDTKHAELIFELSALPGTLHMQADVGTMASGKGAVILNLLCPGLGHMVLERYVTGGAFMGVWILCWIFILGTPKGIAGMLHALGIGKEPAPFNPIVPLALIVAAITWVMAIVTASSMAKQLTPKKIDRPVPPSMQDFE